MNKHFLPLLKDLKIYDAVVNEKQHHWLKEENNRAARAARILAHIRSVLCTNNVKSPNSRFDDNLSIKKVNLS